MQLQNAQARDDSDTSLARRACIFISLGLCPRRVFDQRRRSLTSRLTSRYKTTALSGSVRLKWLVAGSVLGWSIYSIVPLRCCWDRLLFVCLSKGMIATGNSIRSSCVGDATRIRHQNTEQGSSDLLWGNVRSPFLPPFCWNIWDEPLVRRAAAWKLPEMVSSI